MSIEIELRARVAEQQQIIEKLQESNKEQRDANKSLQVVIEKLQESVTKLQESNKEQQDANKSLQITMETGMENLRQEFKTQREKDRSMVENNLKGLFKLHQQNMSRSYERLERYAPKKNSSKIEYWFDRFSRSILGTNQSE